MSEFNLYFGLTGLETDFVELEFEDGGYIRHLETHPEVSDIINAARDHDQGAQIAQYAGQISHELMQCVDTPEQALALRGLALAFTKILGLQTKASVFVPVSSSIPWLSLGEQTEETNLDIVHDFGQVYNRSTRLDSTTAIITKEQIRVARTYIATFAKLDNEDPRFQLATIAYSDSELQQNDRMAAAMIWSGIEGILGIEHELAYRISSILAFALYDAGEQREELYNRVRKLYNVRSRIVHGDQVSSNQVIENYLTAREILRLLLNAILDLGRVPKLEDYERAMLVDSNRSFFYR